MTTEKASWPITFIGIVGLTCFYCIVVCWINLRDYTHGLKEQNIPISSRILRVSTSMSRLMNPLRKDVKARSVEEAMAYIHQYTGTYYDPKVVEYLNKVIHKQNFLESVN